MSDKSNPTSGHTPTPWVIGTENLGAEEIATVAWIGARRVGVHTPGIPGGNYRDTAFGNQEADTAFIVRAVNSHDELVEVLKDISKQRLSTEISTEEIEDDCDFISGYDAIVTVARAALAKVQS
jgi:hypothetical protein